MCLASMMAASTTIKAQEVTITLIPGWTWISCPTTDTLSLAAALGSFTPAAGDYIVSQWGFASYMNGQWIGSISEFYPGYGYKYYSNRMTPVMVTFNVQQSASQVVVTTSDPMLITVNSAMSGGEVTTNDGNYVAIIVRGICWSVNPNPTLNDNYLEVEGGIGSFTASMTSLNIGTTYYIRAYAVTDAGTVFGEEKTFTTKNGIPVLTTASVTDIGRHEATCGGTIIDDGGLTITERGVCWSTSPNPTIMDNYVVSGMGVGDFVSSITGLTISTTYYVRAYATNAASTTYGNEMEFTTQQTWQNGISPGLFSVSASQQVHFSQGNLQYQASTNTWRFATNQYDCVGSGNSNISSTYNGWIDLFGWGTSGYNHGANCYQPWSTGTSYSDYYAYGNYQYNLYDQTGQADWGYNPISNGGNQTNQWRTLTQPEWDYVFNTRATTSGIRYAKANVNNVNGVILLPDDWSASTYRLSNTNSSGSSFSSNTMTASQWSTLEQAGAVFLPTAGSRSGTSVGNVGSIGYYWSASYYDSSRAYSVYFGGSSLYTNYGSRYGGRGVRLVRVAE